MIHVCSMLGYGDSLITLALLERLQPSAPAYRIFGTPVTSQASQLLARPLPVIKVLDQEISLYLIKARGSLRAMRDTLKFRRQVRAMTAAGDDLVFETAGRRAHLLTPAGRNAHVPDDSGHVYADRHKMLVRLFGPIEPWAPIQKPAVVRRLVVNPCARHPERWITHEIIDVLLQIANRRGWSVTLLDPCERYAAFAKRVACYHQQLALPAAAALLDTADLYFGPDSFFIHLAYYKRVPSFGVFLSHWLKFMPPGMTEQKAFLSFEEARDPRRVEQVLLSYVDS